MSDNKEKKPKEKPIKPVTQNPQPGTPFRKEPDKYPIKPAKPSERAGTPMPFGEPKGNTVEPTKRD